MDHLPEPPTAMRNIYFQTAPAAPEEGSAPSAPSKTRQITASPLEEYARRSGETRPIPDALAAIILAPSGKATVTVRGITVESKEYGRVTYWHPDSPLCSDHSNDGKKVVYVIGRRGEILHLLSLEGVYLGTLPAKNRPSPLDQEALAAEFASHQRAIGRAASTLAHLHGSDTRDAVRQAAENARTLENAASIARAHHAPGAPSAEPAPPSRTAAAIAETESHADRGRAILAQRTGLAAEAATHFDRIAERAPAPALQTACTAPADPFDCD